MKKAIVLLFWIVGLSFVVQAQETLLPLIVNPVLKANAGQVHPPLKASSSLPLPFKDDFSYDYWAPDMYKWQDRWAFVNRTFGPLPPSIGMATLDAIDDTGAVYSWATPTPFQADYLTSQPLRLDSILVGTPDVMQISDSLYLSFYYQPQGYGNNPNEDDSLILEFYDPVADGWYNVWAVPGTSYANFWATYHRPFRQIMIPILDNRYLKDGFMFRFRNYASIANSNLPSWQGNMDQWNLDYIYLNYNRHIYDTAYTDITFVSPPQSLLKNYQQMPSRQFSNTELKDTLRNVISNLNNTINNISYQYVVNEVGAAYTHTYLGGDFDIKPYNSDGYHNWQFHTDPAVDFTLPALSGDSVSFLITHTLGINGWADENLENNTMEFRQDFYNYYAYDDGTAEAGYGLAGTGSRLAYGFTVNHPDTLGAVQMYFNQTYTQASSRYFYLMVWESLNPEKVLYKSKRMRPVMGDSLNAFHTYFISDSVVMINGGFYVGWMQVTDEVLNVGYDQNNDASSHVMFNAAGTWEPSVYHGAVMLRPVFGTAGQAKKQSPLWYESNKLTVGLYPNPIGSDNVLHLNLPANYWELDPETTMTVEIFNAQGIRLYEKPFSETIDISSLQQGFYMLRLNSYGSGERCTKTFSITR